jgi:hypothetical protein
MRIAFDQHLDIIATELESTSDEEDEILVNQGQYMRTITLHLYAPIPTI